MSNAYLGVTSTHPLIPREQTYVMDRKLLTVHSVDRDVRKWPQSNHFEVQLPEPMTNVQSMRLVECNLPANYYVFSNSYQNTKLNFKLKPVDATDPYYAVLATNWGNPYVVTISEGFYTPEQMAIELTNSFNQVVTDYLNANGISGSYTQFKVAYHDVQKKFWFANGKDEFTLDFTKAEEYVLGTCEQPDVYEHYTNWGLGFNLGFGKSSVPGPVYQPYSSQQYLDALGNEAPIQFLYASTDPAENTMISPSTPGFPVQYIVAPNVQAILGDNTVYMEVNKYNQYDELVPYVQSTSSMYNNDYGGVVNSAFAKIPMVTIPVGAVWDSRNGFLQGISHFDVPIERITKLEFKFRYHDGRLVDFQEFPFDFTIAFNQLKNEIGRQYEVRVPVTYSL